jgi:predicted phage tail protein
MDKMLTFKEKRYIESLMKSSRNIDPLMWPNWGGWVAFMLGGAVIVYSCFLTVSNLSAESIRLVLMPGILTGMVLLVGGYWIQYMSRKAESDKVLVGILQKLLD